MKTVKIKKRYLKDLEFMYEDLGLAWLNEGKKHVAPDRVLVSKEDYKTIKDNLTKLYQKEFKYYSKKKIDGYVAMHLLSVGPNTLVEDAIKPGYLIIM